MIFFEVFSLILLSINPHLNSLVEAIRSSHISNADSYWHQYTSSLLNERLFSKNTHQLGGLGNVKDREVKFAEGQFTEAEFAHQIGIDFSSESMSIESEWFLNKAESLGSADIKIYFARARNYAKEWNDVLHYNDDLTDPSLVVYEEKWHENLIKFIQHSKDSNDIYEGRLALTSIYWPFRTPGYIDSFAPAIIDNLQGFINDYPDNPLIEQAYERLIWRLYETKKYTRLCEICLNFIKEYPDARIAEYIKFQLGNAYYYSDNFDEAMKIYSSVNQDSFPDHVYPGWGGRYILEDLNRKLDELKDMD